MYAVSGGAPLSKEIAQFFHSAGILILEGYGLTETTAAINCNSPSHYAFGTVGLKVKGVHEKLAEDGEILVKGPMVFQGYYKNPEATREVLSSDGWFKTGDIGEFDSKGYLKITDRKKDLIITAGGKNIAPQNIENQLKTIPVISQAVIIGDRRKYLSALLTLTKDVLEDWAQKSGLQVTGYDELVKHPTTRHWLHQILEEKNKTLPSYESIKRFAILPQDFSQETGELTPTLKVKRKFVNEKYKDIIENLYRD
ncbi:MAG: AMP-binding protein [Deltaproteobacteria bacterium]|nr:MAG: AMP-binding protein [Deltaproteobacteria bacterium]